MISESNDNNDGLRVKSPKSVYFTYQFYTLEPTRTEVLRLLTADYGKAHIFVREAAHARDEIPLGLRYTIDCTPQKEKDNSVLVLNPDYEAREFAEYLARTTLFLEVWDADSLLLVVSISLYDFYYSRFIQNVHI
jgi:hypothetical protein